MDKTVPTSLPSRAFETPLGLSCLPQPLTKTTVSSASPSILSSVLHTISNMIGTHNRSTEPSRSRSKKPHSDKPRSSLRRSTTTKQESSNKARRQAKTAAKKPSVTHSDDSDSTVPDNYASLTAFDVDKHREYDVQKVVEEETVQPSRSADDDDNLTDEQRAWAGIDEILADNGSVYPGSILPSVIMNALQDSHSTQGGYLDEQGEPTFKPEVEYGMEPDSDDDSHDQAMKMLCGYSKSGVHHNDLPVLMDSSFSSLSSQMSHESARSVLSYLSRNNIILQRDISEGPLKDFLMEMTSDLLDENAETNGEENVFTDDGAAQRNGGTSQENNGKEVVLDAIGQQLVNAILTEMQRMRESEEYDEDDYDDGDYDVAELGSEEYSDENDEAENLEDVHEYNDQPHPAEKNHPFRESPKSPKEPKRDPREPDLDDCEEIMEENLNDSIPSMDTFQDDEVTKILDDQDPSAWSTFGDLQFDPGEAAQPPSLPMSPFGVRELKGDTPPVSPDRKNSSKMERSREPASPSRTKRVPKSPHKKKKPTTGIPSSPRTPSSPRKSASRPGGDSPGGARHKTSRKPRPEGGVATPKLARKPVKRSDALTTSPTASPRVPSTPKEMRKSVSRPPATPGKTPKPVRKVTARPSGGSRPPPTPSQRKKPSARSTPRSLQSESHVETPHRRSSPRPEVRKKKPVKGRPEDTPRRSVRKPRPPA